MGFRLAEVEMAMVIVIAGFVAFFSASFVTPLQPCPIPVPPIFLRTVSGSGELVFLTVYSTYYYADGQPQAPVSDLRFELAEYHRGDCYLGPGTVLRQGPLNSLNRSGDLQFHDMAAEGEFSPGNDFFILLNPPPRNRPASDPRSERGRNRVEHDHRMHLTTDADCDQLTP